MQDGSSLFSLIVMIASLLVAMTVHEAMHAYMGLALGDTTAQEEGRVSLNPLRHIDPFMTVLLPAITLWLFHAPILAAKPVPFNPNRVRFGEFGAALIALAGPASNLLMAIIASLIFHVVSQGSLVWYALGIFVELNVLLFIFNLIPIPPLDGSRVLYAVAPEPVQRLMASVEPYGLFIIFALVLSGGASGLLATLDQSVINWLL